jgi:hypothetical protein
MFSVLSWVVSHKMIVKVRRGQRSDNNIKICWCCILLMLSGQRIFKLLSPTVATFNFWRFGVCASISCQDLSGLHLAQSLKEYKIFGLIQMFTMFGWCVTRKIQVHGQGLSSGLKISLQIKIFICEYNFYILAWILI